MCTYSFHDYIFGSKSLKLLVTNFRNGNTNTFLPKALKSYFFPLFAGEVMCQDDTLTAADPTATGADANAENPDATNAAAPSGDTAAPEAGLATTVQGGGDSGDTSGTSLPATTPTLGISTQDPNLGTVAPAVVADSGSAAVTEVPADPKNLIVVSV